MNDMQTQYLERVDPSEVAVIVLGGGRGTRLHPLTRDCSKSAISFGGKYRLIDVCLSNCQRSKLEKLFILTQFNDFSLNRHVWQAFSSEFHGEGFVDIISTGPSRDSNDNVQGTADALRQALPYVTHHQPRYVVVLHGDQIYGMDYRKALLWHEIHESEVTIAGQYISLNEIADRTLLRVDPELRVLEFYDRPRRSDKADTFRMDADGPMRFPEEKPFLGQMGVWIFNTDVFTSLLKNRQEDFTRGILPKVASRHTVYCFPFDGYWEDVGTIEAFYRANMEWRAGDGLAAGIGAGDGPVTHARQLPPSRIDGSLVEDSVIADGAHVSANRVSRSIVGIRARIREETIVEDCIVMGNDDPSGGFLPSIGPGCRLKRVIVDKNVSIGENCSIVNQDSREEAESDLCVIRSGIVVIPQGTVIPPGTTI